MPNITLPDGSVKSFDAPVTGLELAESIGPGLAKAAMAMIVNEQEVDLSTTITTDATVTFLTAKDAAGLDVMRHTTTAQVLARAVKELYPSAKLAIGPTVEHGFYYDVEFAEPLSSDDLPKIEAKMQEIIKEGNPVTREELPAEEVKQYFADKGETYKVDIIERAIESGELLDGGKLSIFRQTIEGKESFVDLCRGPHATNTGKCSTSFTLTNLAGAYWRGDSDNAQLTRIYGVSFADKKELKAHLHMLEEAVKRDHRKLGPALDLFHLQEEAPGQVFWHDKGWTIFLELQKYIREKLRARGYEEVNTPQLINSSLYKQSGHWDKFGTGEMFLVEDGDKTFAMKPMNCPCHVQIFNHSTRSYRDLPIKMSEFGTCMRNEAHGALHGLMRVTSMTQDDAHVFCRQDQIEEQVIELCDLIKEIYAEFGFGDVFVKFSDRPELRAGSDEVWDDAEEALKRACDAAHLEWVLNPGEGAFYGPKLEFVLKDCLGRDWQCGTVQMDFVLPDRLGAVYDGEDGNRHTCVMIHRALLGSLERFTGILIENFAAHFPLWLSPVQAVVTGITSKQNDAVEELAAKMKAAGLRVTSDTRNEKVSYKVREHSVQKVPYILVLGDREIENGTVTVRQLGSDAQTVIPVEELIANMQEEIATRALPKYLGSAEEKAA